MDDFLEQSFFSLLPSLKDVRFQGTPEAKLSRWQGVSDNEPAELLVKFIVSKESADEWKSLEDLIKYGIDLAVPSLRGIYAYELLGFSSLESLKSFKPQNFSTWIVNHANKLQPGQKQTLGYAGVLGTLKKLIPEEWGKIRYESYVERYSGEPDKIDLFFKKQITLASTLIASPAKKQLVIVDLSREPLIKFGMEIQTERLQTLVAKVVPEYFNENIFYYLHNRVVMDLGAQYTLQV